jgi:hypothetical protein
MSITADVKPGDEVRGSLPNGSMVRGDLEQISGDKATIRDQRDRLWTVQLDTVKPTQELEEAKVVNQRQLREDMSHPSYDADEQAIHDELLARGASGASVSEIATATGTRFSEATIQRTIRLLREDDRIALPRPGTDADGSARYFAFPAGKMPAGFKPPQLGIGINEASEQVVLTWLSQNPGVWTVDEVAKGLGLPNKGESIGALVRHKLRDEGKVNVHKDDTRRGRVRISFNKF